MPRDDDEAPDPRHSRSGSGLLMFGGLAGSALVAVVFVGGFYLTVRVRNAARTARAEAEMMHAEAIQAEAAMEKMKVEDGEQIQPVEVNLSKVTIAGAERLAGRPVFVEYDLFDNDDRRANWIVYSNDGPASDGDGVERSLYAPDRLANLTGSGRGRIQVIRHPVGGDGTEFPAYVELRVVLDR